MVDDDIRLAGLSRLMGRLDSDVLFTMSLGSKELFHSNMLGWYLRCFPALRAALLDAWEVPAHPADPDLHLQVLRESQHFDLMVHEPGRRALVIENKVFALPTRHSWMTTRSTPRKRRCWYC